MIFSSFVDQQIKNMESGPGEMDKNGVELTGLCSNS